MKRKVLLLLFFLGLLLAPSFTSASLGISPSITEINFVENGVYHLDYRAFSDKPNQRIILYAKDDFAQYTTFEKTSLVGGGSFGVTINFPGSMDKPGVHNLHIYAAEEISQRSFIGTSVAVGAVVHIFVPYPGKYIEPHLNIPSANVGDKIPVELQVINRGTENLTVTPDIIFYDSSGKKVDEMIFDSVPINRGELEYFRRYLDSEGLSPDVYTARAIIDYNGNKQEINSTFKVGNLTVSVVNFTGNVTADEINKFTVRVKSNWNGEIRGVYADVKIWLNESTDMAFKIPSVDLAPWEEKDIQGYFDAEGLSPGKYKIGIILAYAGQTSYSSGEITVVGKGIDKMWFIVIGGIVVALVLAIAVTYLLFRNKKK